MSDMFNQLAEKGEQQQPQPNDGDTLPARPAPQSAQGSTPSPASPQATSEWVQSPDEGGAATPLAPSDGSSRQPATSSSAVAPPVASHVSPTTLAPPYMMHGIEIRLDASAADFDRLASKLGRPKTNVAAEDLTRKWSNYIHELRSRRVPFDMILQVMFAGPDQDAFKTEFTEKQQVTDKTLRKFRTLVGSTRADDDARKRAGEPAS